MIPALVLFALVILAQQFHIHVLLNKLASRNYAEYYQISHAPERKADLAFEDPEHAPGFNSITEIG